MNKKIVLLIAVLVVNVGFLSGCNKTNTNETNAYNEKILGMWLANATTGPGMGSTGIYTFCSNGSFLASSDSRTWGTFEITNEKLIMSGQNHTFSYNYTFSDNGNKVTLIDGYWTIILTRQ